MSYTVLARKWRPKNFQELVGQEHVMQALSNALDQQRLHHAYLFTGTRGVGKTTIARIFAKALNCEEGISSSPCGKCSICLSVDEGRFVDLIEIDAASRTKVEDTRELLDNVQYAPTQGKFKVYLIDEVHMLSKSSFNALLKTLEEPPSHVKFLLATTDPHKLPITVLSRCLQFNLLRLTPAQIQAHLASLLNYEKIPFEETALAVIAKAADGSIRDSLSLLDQAIAYSGGNIAYDSVQAMLGLVDTNLVGDLLSSLNAKSAEGVKDVLLKLAQQGADYLALIHQLIEALNLISQVQILGEALDESELGNIAELAQSFDPESVQMLYQIALLSQQDMKLAPTMRIGFEMAVLRMLAFKPFSSAPALGAAKNITSSSSSSEKTENPQPSGGANLDRQEIIIALKKQAKTGGASTEIGLQESAVSGTPPQTEAHSDPGGEVSELEFTKPDDFPELMGLLGEEKPQPTSAKKPAVEADSVSQDYNVGQLDKNLVSGSAIAPETLSVSESVSESASETISPQEAAISAAEPEVGLVAETGTLEESALEQAAPVPLQEWIEIIEKSRVSAAALVLANNSILLDRSKPVWLLSVKPDEAHAYRPSLVEDLTVAFKRLFKDLESINFVEYSGEYFTPDDFYEQQDKNLRSNAVEAIVEDSNIKMMCEVLDMKLLQNSIKPLAINL